MFTTQSKTLYAYGDDEFDTHRVVGWFVANGRPRVLLDNGQDEPALNFRYARTLIEVSEWHALCAKVTKLDRSAALRSAA